MKTGQAIERVMEHNADWQRKARAHLWIWRGEELTGEQIRIRLMGMGITPDHPNAWGGFIAGLVKQGYLRDTGRVRHMTLPRSHARRTPVWRVLWESP